jgi:hypothetical protein
MFNFTQAVQILLFAVVGGTFAWRGAILGAFVITILPNLLRMVPGLGDFNVKDQPEIFTGVILLAIILFLPNGLISAALGFKLPGIGTTRTRKEGQAAAPVTAGASSDQGVERPEEAVEAGGTVGKDSTL